MIEFSFPIHENVNFFYVIYSIQAEKNSDTLLPYYLHLLMALSLLKHKWELNSDPVNYYDTYNDHIIIHTRKKPINV